MFMQLSVYEMISLGHNSFTYMACKHPTVNLFRYCQVKIHVQTGHDPPRDLNMDFRSQLNSCV